MNFSKNIDWSTASYGEEYEVDRGVVGGALLAFTLIGLGVFFGGAILNFINLPCFLIVIGGTVGATLVHFSTNDIQKCIFGVRRVLFIKEYHPAERIEQIVQLANAIRQEGLLVLERHAKTTEDPFLRLAFELTVDGQAHDDVRRILETEIRTANDRANRAIQVFETMGNYAPAMGLIGTLIGLIQMLGSLDNPALVGPAMATALITTFYGAILANLVFLPISGKLKNKQEEENLVKAVTIEGVLSLGKQENPIVVEQKLQGFLPIGNDI
ncbi:MAG: MotA/TolQ/ExbB proton channel family protein [Bdellovibrionales bacterium]|nr:MotA/TolQ/ExbB proton channel family protein [Bdellovibrionales bacterium]